MVTDASSLNLMQDLRMAQGYDGWTVGDGHSKAIASLNRCTLPTVLASPRRSQN
jgi:hypothetical protein